MNEQVKNENEILEALKDFGLDINDKESVNHFLMLAKDDAKANAELHRLNRASAREKTKSQKERSARTHLLCSIGGTFLSLYPDLATFSDKEIANIIYDYFFKNEVADEGMKTAMANAMNRRERESDG